jgi:hypothetical protein
MKYDLVRLAKTTLVNTLCLFIGTTFVGLFFGAGLNGVYMGLAGIIFAWPALILAAIYTEYLLNKQATGGVNNEQ